MQVILNKQESTVNELEQVALHCLNAVGREHYLPLLFMSSACICLLLNYNTYDTPVTKTLLVSKETITIYLDALEKTCLHYNSTIEAADPGTKKLFINTCAALFAILEYYCATSIHDIHDSKGTLKYTDYHRLAKLLQTNIPLVSCNMLL